MFKQVEIIIIGLEKDRTIYIDLFLKYQFIQLKMNPDLVIKLIVPPEVAILRKTDHSILKIDIIGKLNYESVDLRNIDVMKNYYEWLMAIKKLIWDYLFQLSKMNG